MTTGRPIRAVAVVVPAHDEQDLLPACLDALDAARRSLSTARPGVAVSVTVVLDACRDETARIVGARPGVAAVEIDARCVGAARAAGSTAAIRGFAFPPDTVWTAHTDADSCVAADWLTGMVDLADAGVDVVLGTVTPDRGIDPAVEAAWAALNPPVDDHLYVHGANLGVRASTLAAVGGWRALPTGEDVDLVARLRAAPGAVVRSIAARPVVTSSRTQGRTPHGFSSYLREISVA